MGERINIHATAIVAGEAGVLILGPSGAGKSSLALAAIGLLRAHGRFASLLCDDRVWLSVAGGRLVAEAPQTIAGLVEIRGCGPVSQPFEHRAVVAAAVRLVAREAAPRLAAADDVEMLLGIALPRLDLAEGDAQGAARALAAWLDHQAF
jgi:serine kinase of HPr protein (carbohydrate metabolism regulator)